MSASSRAHDTWFPRIHSSVDGIAFNTSPSSTPIRLFPLSGLPSLRRSDLRTGRGCLLGPLAPCRGAHFRGGLLATLATGLLKERQHRLNRFEPFLCHSLQRSS